MRKKDIDKIDLEILNILSQESDITNKKLAQRIGLIPGPTFVRVQNLKKRGVISGQRATINLDYFGLQEYYFSMHCSTTTLKEFDQGIQKLAPEFRQQV